MSECFIVHSQRLTRLIPLRGWALLSSFFLTVCGSTWDLLDIRSSCITIIPWINGSGSRWPISSFNLILYSTQTLASIPNQRHIIRVLRHHVQYRSSISQSFSQRLPPRHRQRLRQGSSSPGYIFADILRFLGRWSCRLWDRIISLPINKRQLLADIVSSTLESPSASFLLIHLIACHVHTSYQTESGQQRLRKAYGNGSFLYSIPRTRNSYRSVVWTPTSSFDTCELFSKSSSHLHSSFYQSCFP